MDMLAVHTNTHSSFRNAQRGTQLAHLMISVPGPTVTMVNESDVVALAASASQLACSLKSARRAIHDYAARLGKMAASDIIEWDLPHGYTRGEECGEDGLRWYLLIKEPEPRTEIEAEWVE